MDIDKYKHDDWVVYFSGGKWSPLGFSSWLTLYTRKIFSEDIDYFVKQTIVVWDGETTTCYIRESERKIFGEKVVKKVLDNPKYIDEICDGFRSGTDSLLSIYGKNQKSFTYQNYADYNALFLEKYYPCHIQVKNVVDFLPKKLLEKYLPNLERARVHAEPVFSQEIDFMNRLSIYLNKRTGYKSKLLLHCFTDEIIGYWKDGKMLPSEDVLKQRFKGSVIFFESGKIQNVLISKDVSQFSSIFIEKNSNIVKGTTAFSGHAKGTVRIIFDPLDVKVFNKGDVLIAPWTRPEYLPLMKKAGAFVTDGGGILSHAAIVARELKKPCIIGTKNATKIFKDGDMVEVDAMKGVVRKLNKK